MKEISSKLKQMTSADDGNEDMKGLRDELKEALAAQEDAHDEVQQAANAALAKTDSLTS